MSYLRDQNSGTPLQKKSCRSHRLSNIAKTEGSLTIVDCFKKVCALTEINLLQGQSKNAENSKSFTQSHIQIC